MKNRMIRFANEIDQEFMMPNSSDYKCSGIMCTNCPFNIDAVQNESLWYGTQAGEYTNCVLTYVRHRTRKLEEK